MSASRLSTPMLLLDGGLGTTLEDEHDITFSASTPLWSSHLLITSPETLQKVQADFAEASANIILTATYQASLSGFRRTTLDGVPIPDSHARKYMVSAVDIARSAFQGKDGTVALSLGAYGATMVPSTEYSGEYGSFTEEDLVEFHRERLQTFNDPATWAKIDVVAFETLPRLNEIRAVRRVIREAPDKPYWISCVFPEPDVDTLPDGSSIAEAVKAMLEDGRPPYLIGINCTKLNKVPALVKQFEEAIDKLGVAFPGLVIYPDGADDKVYDTKRQEWVKQDAIGMDAIISWDESMLNILLDIEKRGRWKNIIVGGCCKTSPAMIAKLKARVDEALDIKHCAVV